MPPPQSSLQNISQSTNFESKFFTGCSDKKCPVACFCPYILFGRTRAKLLNGSGTETLFCVNYLLCKSFCPFCYNFFYMFNNRIIIREKYGIKGNCIKDCILHTFCHCNALIQEENEVILRENINNNNNNTISRNI